MRDITDGIPLDGKAPGRLAGDEICGGDEFTCAKLRAKAGGGLVIDLCEDEQWEVAARAGTRTYWTNGGVYVESVDTWKGYVDEIAIWKRNTTVEVGYMKPNPWGLYDTVGNLREWTLDKTDGISGGTVVTMPRTDPVGPNVGANRVYRGWIMQPDPPLCYMMPANRNDAAWFGHGTDLGTLVKKTLAGQLIGTILVGLVPGTLFFRWVAADFSIRRVRAEWPRRFFREACLALLLANWIVWIPVNVCTYAFPLSLQIQLVGLAGCFWMLVGFQTGKNIRH